jgi:thioredoxin-related protein
MSQIKIFFSIAFLLITINTSFGQKQTLFLDKDFDLAIQQAKTEKKPVILMFYASWCVHCNKMKNEVFTNQQVIDYYNKNYICIASDIESKEGIALREKFKNQLLVKSFPTFAFLDINGNVTNSISGEIKSDVFIKEGSSNLNPENHFQNIKSKFERDVSNYDNCFAYILATKRLGFNPTEITQKYLKTVSANDYYTEKNWRLFSNGITDFDAPEFISMIKNRTQFEKAVSSTRIDRKINYVINENFNSFIDNSDSVNYKKNRIIAENLKIRTIDSLLFFKDVNFYERTQNWKAYNQTLEKNMTQFGLKDANFINNVSANYFIYIDDKKMLFNAVAWQKQAIKLSPSLNKYVMISNLLLKSKEYAQGLEQANLGKQFAESLNFNTSEIDAVILEIKSKMK